MELWIRSTARNNLLKVRFLTIMQGEKFYCKDDWEFKGYTICNCNEQGYYELLGTYKTKERALEVLDEIQKLLMPVSEYKREIDDLVINYKNIDTIVYEMPED